MHNVGDIDEDDEMATIEVDSLLHTHRMPDRTRHGLGRTLRGIHRGLDHQISRDLGTLVSIVVMSIG